MASQNVSGPEPGFLVGNLTDIASLIAKSTSADMESIDHDIVGRLMPHYVLWSKIYGMPLCLHLATQIIPSNFHELFPKVLSVFGISGKRFMFWYGSEPRLCLTEIDMIKELLSSKYVHISGKSWLQQQGSKHFIGQGLLMANGDNWFRQRHVVAPAFMADKLKVIKDMHHI